MSKQFEALSYVVGLRIADLANQQLRAGALAAADGVLFGFAASLISGAKGSERQLIQMALGILVLAVLTASYALWPAHLGPLGRTNPAAITGNTLPNDDAIENSMMADLSSTFDRVVAVAGRRSFALAVQVVVTSIAFGLLLAAALLSPEPR